MPPDEVKEAKVSKYLFCMTIAHRYIKVVFGIKKKTKNNNKKQLKKTHEIVVASHLVDSKNSQ